MRPRSLLAVSGFATQIDCKIFRTCSTVTLSMGSLPMTGFAYALMVLGHWSACLSLFEPAR